VAIASEARGLPFDCPNGHGPARLRPWTMDYRRPTGWTVTLACGCALDDLASVTNIPRRNPT